MHLVVLDFHQGYLHDQMTVNGIALFRYSNHTGSITVMLLTAYAGHECGCSRGLRHDVVVFTVYRLFLLFIVYIDHDME